jgi:hypothetical protein
MWFIAVAFDWAAKHQKHIAENGWQIGGTDVKQVASKYTSVVSK